MLREGNAERRVVADVTVVELLRIIVEGSVHVELDKQPRRDGGIDAIDS